MFKAKSQGFLHRVSCAVIVIFTLEPGHCVTGPGPNWQGLTEHMVPAGLSWHWGLPKGTFQAPRGGGRGRVLCANM